MAKPVNEWTEDDVLALPPDENDWFERKGAKALDLTIAGVSEDAVLNELAKQLSAFSNTGGGQIIYGVGDKGAVDNGGIARSIKGTQSTKDWIESIIPTLTDFEIVGCNVDAMTPKASGSSLDPTKSLYIVDVPDSDRAPHQSKRDHKYYVRLGGRSQPASHRLIEDIRNRARHPILDVHDVRLQSASGMGHTIEGLRSKFQLTLSVRFGLHNVGKVRASTSCLRLSSTSPLSVLIVATTDYSTRSAPEGVALLELNDTLYPEMDILLGCGVQLPGAEVVVGPQSESMTVAGIEISDVSLLITSFADSAPPRQQEFKMSAIDPDRHLTRLIREEIRRIQNPGQHRPRSPSATPWS